MGNKTQSKSSEINIIFNARFVSRTVTPYLMLAVVNKWTSLDASAVPIQRDFMECCRKVVDNYCRFLGGRRFESELEDLLTREWIYTPLK